MRLIACLPILAALPLAGAPPPDTLPETRVRARVDIEEVVVDALAVDGSGNPIPDLVASDFSLEVEGRPVPLTAAEWIPPARPDVDLSVPTEGVPRFPQGRLLVFFFQTDFTRMRLYGQMEIAGEAVRLLKELLPSDLVAVVSFDSHLKLWLDFTTDRARAAKAVFDAILIGKPPALSSGLFPSLAEAFDYREAAKASTVEKGLAVTARALSPIAGGKYLLYFGWGLKVNHSPREGRDFGLALGSLKEAQVTVFALDFTRADSHTLEGGLKAFAELTGGTYQKTYYFPAGALDLVFRETKGHYLLSFARPALPRGVHRLEVKLSGRKGSVLARPYYDD